MPKGELPSVIYCAENNCLYRYDPVVIEETDTHDVIGYEKVLILAGGMADHVISGVSSVEDYAITFPRGGTTHSVEIISGEGDLWLSNWIVNSPRTKESQLNLTFRSENGVFLEYSAALRGTNIVIDADRLVVYSGRSPTNFFRCTSVTLPAVIVGHRDGELWEFEEGKTYLKFHEEFQELHYGGTAEQWAHYSQLFDFTACKNTVTVYCADGTESVAWEPQKAESN